MSGTAPPWTLAFELSNPTSGAADASSLALGRGGALVASEHVAPAMPRSEEDDLFPAIQRLLARASLKPMDLRGGRIAVSVGPGGYTGLRVACAASKVLAEAVGARCVAVPTALVALRAFRQGVAPGEQSPPSPKAAVALASKTESAWVYVEGQADATAARFVSAANLAGLVAEHGVAVLIADSHLPKVIREACAGCGVAVVPPVLSAAACLAVAVNLPDIEPELLLPVYAREPDAVTLWRLRK